MKALIIAMLFTFGGSILAQEVPPVPTLPPELSGAAAEAADLIDSLPTDPTTLNGVQVLPETNAVPLFEYVKWVISPTSTRELLGPQFHVFGDMAVAGLLVFVVLTGVYIVIRIVIIIVRVLIFVGGVAVKAFDTAVAVADLIKPG